MQAPPIKDFKEFIEPSLNGAKLLKFTTRYLTALGDNYGSTMLAVTAQIQHKNGKEETLELVAKMQPTNAQLLEIFQTEITFIKENKVYAEIGKRLVEFQKEMNVPENEIYDCLPYCYGSRISLDKNTTKVDSDAVLVLENLNFRGFKVCDRIKGFDKDHTYIVLKALAQFNAVPIAYRYSNPDQFDKFIRPALIRIEFDSVIDDDVRAKMQQSLAMDISKCKRINHLLDRVFKQMEKCQQWQNDLTRKINHPFATIVHNDFWVNNMMIGYDDKGHPTDVKIVDFQLTMYESFVHDLLFFLFTSVNWDVLENGFDDFVKHYYNEFIKNLKLTKCPLEDFTYEKFMDEINRAAPYELLHIFMMLRIVLLDKDGIPKKHDDYSNDLWSNRDIVGDNYFNRMENVILQYEKRNWIL